MLIRFHDVSSNGTSCFVLFDSSDFFFLLCMSLNMAAVYLSAAHLYKPRCDSLCHTSRRLSSSASCAVPLSFFGVRSCSCLFHMYWRFCPESKSFLALCSLSFLFQVPYSYFQRPLNVRRAFSFEVLGDVPPVCLRKFLFRHCSSSSFVVLPGRIHLCYPYLLSALFSCALLRAARLFCVGVDFGLLRLHISKFT